LIILIPLVLLLKKSFNLLTLLLGYLLSRISRRVVHLGVPAGITVEPTNSCNLKCPECPSGQGILTRDKGFLGQETFRSIIDNLSPAIFYLTFYFQGEPFLHPAFSEMIRYAKMKNIYVHSSTNGHFLTSENVSSVMNAGLDRLIVSLDGTDQVSYSSYRRGGTFSQVTDGIREIICQKKKSGSSKPMVILQFLVLKSNEHQIQELKELGKKLEADKVVIKSAQFNNFREGNPLMPVNDKYSRYILKKDSSGHPEYLQRNKMPNHCFRMWSSCVITWDGWVVPCCFDKDAKYRMGNLNEESFQKIWRGKKYRDFRNKILHDRKSIDICNNCTEGMGISRIL
jgi:radical SAM protein with 4Fe4S-binding SPASM domain